MQRRKRFFAMSTLKTVKVVFIQIRRLDLASLRPLLSTTPGSFFSTDHSRDELLRQSSFGADAVVMAADESAWQGRITKKFGTIIW